MTLSCLLLLLLLTHLIEVELILAIVWCPSTPVMRAVLCTVSTLGVCARVTRGCTIVAMACTHEMLMGARQIDAI